ncbi:hypothetical protein [Amedibacillus sp. YH-ame10]
MKISVSKRALIAGIMFITLNLAFNNIQKILWPSLNHSDIAYIVECILAVSVVATIERLLYDFDPSHNGVVYLKKEKSKL